MGFNTVAFILNDLSSELERSPKTVAHMLSHPPMSAKDEAYYNKMYREIAHSHNEKIVHEQALRMLPTFHADFTQYLMAGGNNISNLSFVKYNTYKGRKCVMLELPECMQDKK